MSTRPKRQRKLLLGIFDGRRAIEIRRGDFSGNRPDESKVKIGVISDCHIGPYVRESFLRRAIEMVNAENCDLAVIPGDIASSFSRRGVETAMRTLSEINCPGGVLACLGNHDIRCGRRRVINAMEQEGITPLVNSHITLTIRGRSFVFAGLDDVLHGSPSAADALSGAPQADSTIILCHNPDGADMLSGVSRPIDLMICGHTHGSQVRLFDRPVMRGTKNLNYDRGTTDGPDCPVFISAGLGVTRWPIRYNCPPEIGIVTV